ncbi:MAG: WG repeat-containing protein [Bacteroidota bacterium]
MKKYILLLLPLFFYHCKNDPNNFEPDNSLTLEEEVANLPPEQEDFSESRDKWGFINRNGAMVIPARYDDARDFQGGLAPVQIKGEWGFINRQGELVIPAQYKGVWAFQEGLARAMTWEGEMGFLNAAGKWVIPAVHEEVQDFHNGLARVRKDGIYGYLNSKGEVVIDYQFAQASDFEKGFAKVKGMRQYGLIAPNGTLFVPDEYEQIYLPSNGKIRAKSGGKFGYLDLEGAAILPFKYEAATDFVNGVAAVKENGSYQLIDADGATISDPFDRIWYGEEGLWLMNKNDLFGALSSEGEVVIEPIYEQLLPFGSGRTFFQQNKLWGMMDTAGNVLTAAEFGLAWSFDEDLARVAFYEGTGYLNPEGQLAIRPRYREVRDFENGLARVQVNR